MRRPLLRECAHTGCSTLTMGRAGALCIRHDVPVARTFPRGRPYVIDAVLSSVQGAELRTVDESLAVLALSVGDTRY